MALDFLRASLKFLTDEDLQLLAQRLQDQRYRAGDTILREGDRHQGIWVLRSGSARIMQDFLGTQAEINHLDAPALFGEMSFLESRPASASVIADEDCDVAFCDGVDLQSLLASVPGLGSRFYQSIAVILSGRLRRVRHSGGSAPESWG